VGKHVLSPDTEIAIMDIVLVLKDIARRHVSENIQNANKDLVASSDIGSTKSAKLIKTERKVNPHA